MELPSVHCQAVSLTATVSPEVEDLILCTGLFTELVGLFQFCCFCVSVLNAAAFYCAWWCINSIKHRQILEASLVLKLLPWSSPHPCSGKAFFISLQLRLTVNSCPFLHHPCSIWENYRYTSGKLPMIHPFPLLLLCQDHKLCIVLVFLISSSELGGPSLIRCKISINQVVNPAHC